MAEFTPGPWRVEPANEPDEGVFVVRYWQDGCEEIRVTPQIIASVECDEGGDGPIPNARLIAAAPDLYEACQACAQLLRSIHMTYGFGSSPYQSVRSQIALERESDKVLYSTRAALAKAKGGSE